MRSRCKVLRQYRSPALAVDCFATFDAVAVFALIQAHEGKLVQPDALNLSAISRIGPSLHLRAIDAR
jgi:hypothetical protein